MGSDYRKDFIIQNLDKVIKCTIVGIELLAKLCSLKLIDETQLEELVSIVCFLCRTKLADTVFFRTNASQIPSVPRIYTCFQKSGMIKIFFNTSTF